MLTEDIFEKRKPYDPIEWGTLEKKERFGWIAVILFLVVFIIVCCAVEGVTKEQEVIDGDFSLPVIQLMECFTLVEEEPNAIHVGDGFFSFANNPYGKDKEIGEDAVLPVYHVPDGEKGVREIYGSYPIVSKDRARNLLSDGRYFSKADVDFPGDDAEVDCGIVYRNDGSKFIIPFYAFCMDLTPENQADEEWGLFYVPAVEGQYLDNLSVWHEKNEGE